MSMSIGRLDDVTGQAPSNAFYHREDVVRGQEQHFHVYTFTILNTINRLSNIKMAYNTDTQA